ncbi:deoxyribose-phosphate aldolase [Aureibaculum algae]|uniref:Deoxyribose-phosphate aldolase n=1 Tax=Aureibaculum algae TaxID=2584122 RepID=A0A5B7TRQ2_9FLAO|nr:deoxyribose-phosphate aldolase [Aureibaculum algae]QCX37262.1 deoxyribose-phosphate aldolase [Aureibaculum algae]
MNSVTKLEIAKMIDHSLLHPTMDDKILIEGCEIAKKYNVASVCIKPYAVKMAVEILKGTDVMVGTVIGFPHGSNTLNVKIVETEEAIKDGAVEIDMVVNIGKVLSEDWTYIENEIKEIHATCKKGNAALKVIFENDFLPEDFYKIKLCELCSKLKVDFVKTSTGYGMVKQPDGSYNYKGATEHDLKLMRRHTDTSIEVKAAGGVRTLEDTLKVKSWGVTRIGATATEAIVSAVNGE